MVEVNAIEGLLIRVEGQGDGEGVIVPVADCRSLVAACWNKARQAFEMVSASNWLSSMKSIILAWLQRELERKSVKLSESSSDEATFRGATKRGQTAAL